MIATDITRAARAAARAPIVVLSLAVALAGCGASRPSSVSGFEQPTITFENTSNAMVRVYVVSESGEWLLGRVQPAETARLRLPAGLTNPDEPLSISAVPLAATGAYGMRLGPRSGYAVSPMYPLRQLVAARWGIAGQQIYTNILR